MNRTHARLLTEQIPRLRRYARALAGDAQEADDLVQDCLERAWARSHLFRAGSDARRWLFTILHNLFLNRLRDRGRQPAEAPLEESAHPAAVAQEGGLVVRDLERALAALAPEQREVVLLVGLEGMSYEEVARVLGVPQGTVMSRLHRGRERLRGLMAGGLGPRERNAG